MRAGGSKKKGADFERRICRLLSLWVSNRKLEDLFWRSAMSGGRATVALQRGIKLNRQAGDICSVSPEGHTLTNHFYVELKHLKKLSLDQFFLLGQGPLVRIWQVARKQAENHDKHPLLIIKQNHLPEIVVTEIGALKSTINFVGYKRLSQWCVVSNQLNCEVHLLSKVLKHRYGA